MRQVRGQFVTAYAVPMYFTPTVREGFSLVPEWCSICLESKDNAMSRPMVIPLPDQHTNMANAKPCTLRHKLHLLPWSLTSSATSVTEGAKLTQVPP